MKDSRGKSTGPKSAAGKGESSQNATTHGLRSNVVRMLPGEKQEDYDALGAMWQAQYGPYVEDNPALVSLLNSLIDNDWMQQRCMRVVSESMARLFEAEAGGTSDEAVEKCERGLASMMRYKTSFENSFARALRAIEQFRATRRRESLRQQALLLGAVRAGAEVGGKLPPVAPLAALERLPIPGSGGGKQQ